MDISAATALVTGANRGFGRAIASELLTRGATVWAAARDSGQIDLPGARPLQLDITDPASVAAAAAEAGDVTLLINNAGSATGADLLTGDLEQIRLDMETHYFGTLSVVRAFAPVIEGNGGGTILNVLSVLSWLALPGRGSYSGAYSGAKSAQWGLTNSLRLTLAPAGIRVAGLHVGYMDTDMTRAVTAAKHAPADIARYAVDQLAAGAYEIVADDVSRDVRGGLSGGVAALYPQLP
ncbi:SDR family oxidoreductase [Micromonospora thermarum]|uniref:SDR family oxidoreductase n=1 Tax=Micromonospora thermarum TaxID=2720024 RepID=A0ABX0Z9Z6_9ACTN|nr:SDR family oxidoreductase [Micromonospora thermarum]NJP34303.1 SDR family oxidoreductase [Micromonospora thermarum]